MRLSAMFFPSTNGTGINWGDYEAYGYDNAGNRLWLRKRDNSVLTYGYDALNRMTVKIVPERAGLSSTHTRDVHYGYDLRNLPLFARFDSPTGEGVTNTYDAFGRLTSTSINMGGVTRTLSYQVREDSLRTRITHPDGTYFDYAWDGLARPTYLSSPASWALNMTYYEHGAPSIMSRLNGTASDFWYDGIQRQRAFDLYPYGAPHGGDWQIARNPAGQITSVTRANDSYAWQGHYAVNRAYTVNGLNQYTAAGGATFGYDGNGNLTSDGGETYYYDVENRLVQAAGPRNVTLLYDPLGRIFQYSYLGGAGWVTTTFLYDGDALVAEYGGATLLRRYAHWVGADVPAIQYEGATLADPRYLFADHQGSIIAAANAGGTATINRYDEYGIPASTNTGRFQYTGQIWLAELGMYHYKARIYSPTLGRFLQIDPVGYGDQFNLYAYVRNDPVNHLDPDGQRVTAIYAPSNRGLLVYDNDTRRAVYTQADTGYDFVNRRATLPIPDGMYSILEHGRHGEGYYRLEGHDSTFGDDAYQGRSLLRFHGRGRGYNDGCISVCTDAEMRRADSIISSTRTGTTEVQSKSRLRNTPLGSPTERLRDYGTLEVLPRGMNLNLNPGTGEVSISLRTPPPIGSRLPGSVRVCTFREGRCQ